MRIWGGTRALPAPPRDPTTDPAPRFAPRGRRLDLQFGPEALKLTSWTTVRGRLGRAEQLQPWSPSSSDAEWLLRRLPSREMTLQCSCCRGVVGSGREQGWVVGGACGHGRAGARLDSGSVRGPGTGGGQSQGRPEGRPCIVPWALLFAPQNYMLTEAR